MKRWWKVPIVSPAGFLKLAVLFVVLFLLASVLGLRAYTTAISGTPPAPGVSLERASYLGGLYLILYFGAVLVAPILRIAAGVIGTAGRHDSLTPLFPPNLLPPSSPPCDGLTRRPGKVIITIMTKRTLSVAEAKKRLSEIIVRAAYGHEVFVITRRGRPAVVLRAVGPEAGRADLADLRGWLSDADPLFAHIEESRRLSRKRGPRAAR